MSSSSLGLLVAFGATTGGFSVHAEASHAPVVAALAFDPALQTGGSVVEQTTTPFDLIEALGRPTTREKLHALLLAAEQTRVEDPTLRESLRRILLTHARNLRDDGDTATIPLLWSALRRFASLAPPEMAPDLVEFLRPGDPVEIRQSALLGLYSILELRPLPHNAGSDTLRDRLTDLAFKYLDSDWLISGHNTALALAAFTAAILAEVPRGHELALRLRALDRPRLLRRAHERLDSARASRLQRALAVPDQLHTILSVLGDPRVP